MEDLYIKEADKNDLEKERYELALERISGIAGENACTDEMQDYFRRMASFVLQMHDTWKLVESGELKKLGLEQLQKLNRELYMDIMPENYASSYANPVYAVHCLGESMGQLLSFLNTELRAMIPAVFEQNRFDMVIRMELLLEIYQAFVCAAQEKEENEELAGIPEK